MAFYEHSKIYLKTGNILPYSARIAFQVTITLMNFSGLDLINKFYFIIDITNSRLHLT